MASLYYIIVTMLTVGYGDIHPTNFLERVYGILTMLTGMRMCCVELTPIAIVCDEVIVDFVISEF